MAISKGNDKFFSRPGLWSLFLICALPLHIWTFILAFRDFSWVTERTNSWDALGVVSYGLIFTFFESIAVFITSVFLGLFISRKWDEKKRLAVSVVLITIISIWAMVNHLYFLNGAPALQNVITFFTKFDHPLRALYVGSFLLVTPTFLFPVYFVFRSEVFFRIVQYLVERLSVLMSLYLVVDLAALAIILIRNLRG